MSRVLDVYLHDSKAGELQQHDDATLTFAYNEDYLALERARAISVSMPLAATIYPNSIARPYFSGLLPDESARQRLARALGVSDANAFGMLELIGGECAGALALFQQNADTNIPKADDQVLDEHQLADLLHELRGNPLLGSRNDIRLSLAGAQDKIAVKVIGEQLALVKNGEPTTHILKPGIPGLAGSAQNECFCMMLAARLDLPVADVQFATAGDMEYVLVKRFDRLAKETNRKDREGVERLHQEDFCQALSVAPEIKYEDEGGPGIERSLGLIQSVADQPASDRLVYLKMQIFHFLVGNADAHAKNFALLHSFDSRSPSLAPLYDVVCTATYPELTKKIAMRIGERNIPDTIRLKHWLSLVPNTKASQRLFVKQLRSLAERILPESEALLRESTHHGFSHSVLKDVGKVIKSRASQILQETA